MVWFTIEDIKETTKIQVDAFILFFLCLIFCVYAIRFISMVIVKEIIFACVIYAVPACVTDQKQ